MRISFQLKIGCAVLAVLWCGAASTARAQASAYSGSGSGSNSSSARGNSANGSGSSNGSSGSASESSANSAGSSARKVRSKVAPEYPSLARQVNVTGKVKISVTISADGRVVSTKVLGGSPLLTEAANNAVKQWRYEPGPKESVEIVEVDFSGK